MTPVEPSATATAVVATRRLHAEIGALRFDPLGFVRYAFPWGRAGTPLAGERGPEPWQRDVLRAVGAGLAGGPGAGRDAGAGEAVRLAVASGHGIGKSALVAWIILWAMSTCADTRGVVTANTAGQLRSKTWPELAKWHRLAITRDWFVHSATAFAAADPAHERTWRVDALTWSENNTEAIAGLHNKGRRAFALFDEASAIPDPVWDTVEGALTDAGTELFWLAFGNPTRPAGRFRECFPGGRFAHRWHGRQVDSRSVGLTAKAQIAQWIADYGEDSDFVRMRVRGVFPRAGSLQFIDSARLEAAVRRPLVEDRAAPLVLGVDIARHGEDRTVLRFRQGLDARSLPPVRLRLPDLMEVAGAVLEQVRRHRPDAVFVDATGLGWGVHDRLQQLGCPGLVAVDFGGRAGRCDLGDATARYANKRAEMWGALRDWCRAGCLPDDPELLAELAAVEYGYDASDAILLERKDEMRRRGLASPDDADALALTFAWPVSKPDPAEERRLAEYVQALKRRIV